MDTIGIGALAKDARVRIDIVRYYERSGLLTPRTRLASGYRRYSADEVSRLRFDQRVQGLGFSLKEVRELLTLPKSCDVTRVKRTAEAKLADVERRIASLGRIREGSVSLIEVWLGHGLPSNCPILRALGAEKFP